MQLPRHMQTACFRLKLPSSKGVEFGYIVPNHKTTALVNL